MRLEIVSDSLVPRRLPQLWLRSTLIAREEASGPSIGVLARPAGTEFYSRVLGLPDTLTPTFAADFPMLMRGGRATEEALQIDQQSVPHAVCRSDTQGGCHHAARQRHRETDRRR